MIRFLLFIGFSVVLFISSNLQADESSAFAEIARLRKYVGGADESDLKVQVVLYRAQSSLQNSLKNKNKKQAQPEPDENF